MICTYCQQSVEPDDLFTISLSGPSGPRVVWDLHIACYVDSGFKDIFEPFPFIRDPT
jgi:hypothetical protein